MQYLPFLAVLATALAGQSFSPVVIRSGSQYQYSSLVASGSDIVPGSSSGALNLVLNSDGTLIDTNTKKYVNIGDNKAVTLSSTAQKGYSIDNLHLKYNGKDAFQVCSGKIDFDSSDSSCLGIALRAFSPVETADVTPGSASAAVSSSIAATTLVTTTASTAAASTKSSSVAAASATSVAGKKFGLVAIHSGSNVQNSGIKKVASHPHVFSVGGSEGDFLSLTFAADNSSLADQDGRGVNLDQSTGELGSVAPFGRQPATTGFAIDNEHLTYNGNSGWNACPSAENQYSLSSKECTGGISIALRVVYA